MSIISIYNRLHYLVTVQCGIDLGRLFSAISGLPIFLCDWRRFRKAYAGSMNFKPCFHDRFSEGGDTKDEYFWQDLIVARAIHSSNPIKHVDVGSRIDGFIAHIASFRECEVIDIRPVTTKIPGVIFRQADMMAIDINEVGLGADYCDSLSCLHALEHFGLGRYGDPINVSGFRQGIKNMSQILTAGGTLYLCTPIGRERVEFNANWIFDPRTIIQECFLAGLSLDSLILIYSGASPIESKIDTDTIEKLSKSDYQLALFIFKKRSRDKNAL